MGILNLTPDSFYSPSRMSDEKNVVQTVHHMLADGAHIIDIGGYSTRPGAEPVSEEQEIQRVIPIVKLLKKEFPDLILSVDTFRSKVAESAIELGADMINDISGWQFDDKLLDVVAKYNIPYILMHVEGTSKTMHETRSHDHFFRDVVHYFSEKLQVLKQRGITDVMIDPGFGFSKTIEENYFLLRNLEMLHLLELPILVGN
jgi:dihydropteroate synthase